MTSIAILIGNAAYERESDLACCVEDVRAMSGLLKATARFENIYAQTDMDADAMRDLLRNILSPDIEYEEIFFYFSGHGTQIDGNLYYCGSKFDVARPNETGLSHLEVLSLIRPVSPKLLVKVIDACYSGALLVKGGGSHHILTKEGFRNILQFSSSRDDQTSWAGDRLSYFTKAFLEASVRKPDGVVYYTDIANTLRDNFLENEDQTPFFFSQGTGREVLVSDASVFRDFKARLASEWGLSTLPLNDTASPVFGAVLTPPALEDLLIKAEERMTSSEAANTFIEKLFEGVIKKFDASGIASLFEKSVAVYDEYRESTAEEFMIRVLSKENRPDRLVTAEIERVRKRSTPWDASLNAVAMALDPEWTNQYTLSLNCSIDRAQIVISLSPKYRSLQQTKLVLSCAPSLENCYIFEMVTRHPRTDWEKFSSSGVEVVRRWYKVGWDHPVDRIIRKICDGLEKSIQDHIAATTKRLSGEE